MELKLIDLVRKMEQNNPDLEYFKQGTFTMKPVYMKKSNVIKMEISLPKPLPFQVWDVFCMRLTKLTRCSVDLHITAEKAEAENATGRSRISICCRNFWSAAAFSWKFMLRK